MSENSTTQTLHDIWIRNWNNQILSDKGSSHSYINVYEERLVSFRHLPITLIEFGVWTGASMDLWRKYFTRATLFGVDITDECLRYRDGWHFILGNASDPNLIAEKFANLEFDVIIDDADHTVESQTQRFKLWYPKLKVGGIYFIEDIQDLANSKSVFQSLGSVEVLELRKRYDDNLLIYKK